MMILTLMMARMKILNFDNDYDDDDDDDCSITFASCRFIFAFIVNQYH